MDGDASTHVRQREVRFPVATVSRAEYREQRRILRDGQLLTVTECPAARREVATKLNYLTEEWI